MGDDGLEKLSANFNSRPTCNPARAAAIVMAHAHFASGGKNGNWEVPEKASVLYWIKNGIVIQKKEFDFSKTCVSLAFFANADDIKTDFSGFGLDEKAETETLKSLCAQLNTILPVLEPDLVLHDREFHKKKLKIAGGVAAAGLALKFVFPPAIVLIVAGGVSAIVLSQGIAAVDSALEKGYNELVENWRELVETLS